MIALLRDLRGADSQVAFARRLGIDQPEVSKLFRGERRVARRTIIALLRAYPDRRADIIAALMEEASQQVAIPG